MTETSASPHQSPASAQEASGAPWRLRAADVAALVAARHGDPFAVLGLHETPAGFALRAFVPGATSLAALRPDGSPIAALQRIHPDGLFEALIEGAAERFPYRLRAQNAAAVWEFLDPYAFSPVLGPLDDHLLVEGEHRLLYRRLGAHVDLHENVQGTRFAVWAPDALRVSVVGDFNDWDGRRHMMRKRVDSGVWEIFLPGVGAGAKYKFEILGANGALTPLKADPFGFAAELKADDVASNTLWPKTVIATAAVQNLLGGDETMARARTPEIMADAAYAILSRPPGERTGEQLIDEDVLDGVDLTRYGPTDAFPDLFVD